MKQIDLFEITLPRFKFTHRPIKLFEAFAGIGCQAMTLNKLGIEYETVGISEIDKYAITSYNAIHGKAKNYGDICKMTHIPECDIFTWSFPCTDLSKAGKREGLQGGTRSGLVYEVLRLLQVSKPKVLIMENVPDLIQASFVSEFAEIRRELEELGYSNYVERLNAKDYGVAQNRDRVFMVSILGEWYYEFPQKIKLEKRLKDYLEDEVDEKYYLNEKQLKHIEKTGKDNGEYIQYDRWQGRFEQMCRIWKNYSPTLHTKSKDIEILDNNGIKRHYSPIEVWRLMGISDEDFDKASKVVSNSQLYKQAGNGIVVDVFAEILKGLIESG